MRRWLAIVLLTLLPLQFSWAAVAAYCGHETSETTQHLGHHEHQHADQADSSEDLASEDQTETMVFHPDCGHCQGTCASLPAPGDGLMSMSPNSPASTGNEGILRTLAPNPPERPQWVPLA